MMCTTVLRGGVCHRTSTPHKSGIKMKEKLKKKNNTPKLNDNYLKENIVKIGITKYIWNPRSLIM